MFSLAGGVRAYNLHKFSPVELVDFNLLALFKCLSVLVRL